MPIGQDDDRPVGCGTGTHVRSCIVSFDRIVSDPDPDGNTRSHAACMRSVAVCADSYAGEKENQQLLRTCPSSICSYPAGTNATVLDR